MLFGLHERHQIGDRLFHDARRFDDLRQEHLARPEQIADDIHAGHQRPFDDVERTGGGEPRLFDIGLDEFGDPVDERMFEPLVDRLVAPGEILALDLAGAALEAFGEREEPFGGILAPVEHDVLAGLAQFGIDLLVDGKLAGIDDAHVHSGS